MSVPMNDLQAPYIGIPPELGKEYYCPCCGKECLELWTDDLDCIVGCENCLKHYEAWELLELERNELYGHYRCFPEE